MKFVKMSPTQLAKFWKTVKERLNLEWEKLAKKLNISRSTIYRYRSGKYCIPHKLFVKLCKMCEINKEKLEFEIVWRCKKIKKVRVNQKLAEFVGIIAGDGHLCPVNYEISVAGHPETEREYIQQYVKQLFEGLFGIKPKVEIRSGAVRCRVYSKLIMKFLRDKFNLPLGRKTRKLTIPTIFFNNKRLLKGFIRGLFDTDGSIYTHHGNDLMLEISSSSSKFRKDIKRALQQLGFHPYLGDRKVILYRQKEIINFFKIIKPKNKNHLRRYEKLCKRQWSRLVQDAGLPSPKPGFKSRLAQAFIYNKK